jgi:O-phosphoseryl-tRNA(Cys) synthetase
MTNEEITKILQKINDEADKILQDEILLTLKNNCVDDDEFQHRVTMDTFNASMLDVLTENFPDIDKSVEHDILSWILYNTEETGILSLQSIWDKIELKIRLKLSKF